MTYDCSILTLQRLSASTTFSTRSHGLLRRPHAIFSTRESLGRIGRDCGAREIVDRVLRSRNRVVYDRRIDVDRIGGIVVDRKLCALKARRQSNPGRTT